MSAYAYRPPWPDELERFTALLENELPGSAWRRPRVWETPPPHRFAGVAVWSPPASENRDDPVEIRFKLRPRFCDPLFARELLHDLFAEIAGVGYTRVNLMLPAREPWEAILTHFGLRWAAMNEFWIIDAMTAYDRVRAASARWAARQPEGWAARNIEESDSEFVITASGASDFFDAANLQRVWKNRAPELSCIVQGPAGPAGILLATRFGMTAVLEFLGATPASGKNSALISHLALSHLLRRDHPGTFDHFISLMNPAKGNASKALMRRGGGRLVQTYHIFAGSPKCKRL